MPTIREFAIPGGCSADPVIPTSSGILIWEDGICNDLGQVSPIGTITNPFIAGPDSSVGIGTDLALGPNTTEWFVTNNPTTVGLYMPTSDGPNTYAVANSQGLQGIVQGPDGNMWFTDYGSSSGDARIGKASTSTLGTYTEYHTPTAFAGPTRITVGADNRMWFTESDSPTYSGIGAITTAGAITEYALPAGAQPFGITLGPDGNVWFATGQGAGKITTAGTVTLYSGPTGFNRDITSGPDGNLWLAASSVAAVVRMTTTGFYTAFMTPSQGNPSGIAGGPDGNIWFTEDFTNDVGYITP